MQKTVLSRQQLIALVVLTLMWGVNWPMMKLSLQQLQPLHFRTLTMGLGMLCLAIYFKSRGVRLMPQNRQDWITIGVLAVPNMLGWHGLSIFGLQQLPSGRAAILGFTMPVWTVLIGVLFYRQQLTLRLGVAVGAVLLAIGLLLSNELERLAGSPAGILWMQGAAFAWALGTIWMRRAQTTLSNEALIVWLLGFGTICMAILAWLFEAPQSYDFSVPVWISLAYGVLINYGAAQVLWFGLARALPPSTSAMSIMMIPLIGILSAALIVGEWPQWQDIVAAACVMLAIAAVLLKRAD